MDGRPTLTDCDEAGYYVVPNVLSLVFRPDNMDETVPHTYLESKILDKNSLSEVSFCTLVNNVSQTRGN